MTPRPAVRVPLPASHDVPVVPYQSTKTRLVWRRARILSLLCAVALVWLAVALVWAVVDAVGVIVLLVSSGLFVIINLTVWATVRMAPCKTIAD